MPTIIASSSTSPLSFPLSHHSSFLQSTPLLFYFLQKRPLCIASRLLLSAYCFFTIYLHAPIFLYVCALPSVSSPPPRLLSFSVVFTNIWYQLADFCPVSVVRCHGFWPVNALKRSHRSHWHNHNTSATHKPSKGLCAWVGMWIKMFSISSKMSFCKEKFFVLYKVFRAAGVNCRILSLKATFLWGILWAQQQFKTTFSSKQVFNPGALSYSELHCRRFTFGFISHGPQRVQIFL